MRTTWPSTTSPCLKLLMSESCSASSSSIVVGSGPSSRAGRGLLFLVVAGGRRVGGLVGAQASRLGLAVASEASTGGGRGDGRRRLRRSAASAVSAAASGGLGGGVGRRRRPRLSARRRRRPRRSPSASPRRRRRSRSRLPARWRPRSAAASAAGALSGSVVAAGVVGAGGGLVGDGDRRDAVLGRLVGGGGDRLRLRRGPALLLFGQGSGHSWLWICARESRTA